MQGFGGMSASAPEHTKLTARPCSLATPYVTGRMPCAHLQPKPLDLRGLLLPQQGHQHPHQGAQGCPAGEYALQLCQDQVGCSPRAGQLEGCLLFAQEGAADAHTGFYQPRLLDPARHSGRMHRADQQDLAAVLMQQTNRCLRCTCSSNSCGLHSSAQRSASKLC